ncbi:serine/threonine protein kinase [Spiroplasma endosymbiont of Virgichneumon dumeticola]|uniref:serine/threonine protein kinase n=1 Tax=Spiroplasma endosymbiont of Virgichneumon dumeticola TaxID=3139323 RepID=UPI0035C8ACC3
MAINKILNNRYQVTKQIGAGGMAKVYEAHDKFLDRKVALKIINPISPLDDLIKERFLQEINAVTRIKHPNVILVYDVFIDKADWCLVFELLEGKTLKEYLTTNSVLGVSEAVAITQEILKGINACHVAGIIHRDLKPENIILTASGAIKVLDFGIAVIDNYEVKKHANQVVGTMKYIAPEVVLFQQPTTQSDIYAMGIILYELLIGEPPFFHKNPQILASKHIKEPMPLVRNINNNIPQSLENIIMKATCKTVAGRYQMIEELQIDLATCLESARKNEKRTNKTQVIILKNKTVNLNVDKLKQPFYAKRWFLFILIIIICGLIGVMITLLV